MTLCSHSSRVYMDQEDMEGLLRSIEHKLESWATEEDGISDHDFDMLAGAHRTVTMLSSHRFRDQSEFMACWEMLRTQRHQEATDFEE